MPANATFTFELEGLAELEKMLLQLPKAMNRTVLRNALKKAAVPIRDAAVANVPKGETGRLQDSISIASQLNKNQRRGTRRSKDTVTVYVGSTDSKAHLIEFGTVERYRKSGGRTGRILAEPFLTRAWDATKQQALEILRVELLNQLVKAAARLRKKAVKGTLGRRAERELL